MKKGEKAAKRVEVVYKIKRHGLKLCVSKENKERDGGEGKEEGWDSEINFYGVPTVCQVLLDTFF